MNPTLFKALAANPKPAAIARILAADIELHTPVTLRPFEGRGVSAEVLSIVLGQVIENAKYTGEYLADRSFCMAFRGNIGTAQCQGFDLVELNADYEIRQLTVALRPLPALLAMARRMASRLHAVRIPIPASGPLETIAQS